MHNPPSYRVLHKFTALVFSRWLKEGLQALFLIVLARRNAATFGEFVLALELGMIVLLMAEFGFNLALVKRLGDFPGEADEALSQTSLLKAGLLTFAWLGALGFILWQGYPSPLREVTLLLAVGVGLEALASTFFAFLEVKGRQALEGKIKALAAMVGLGYAFLTLAWGAPPPVMAFFKILENLVNLLGVAILLVTAREWRWRWPRLSGLAAAVRQGLSFGLIAVISAVLGRVNLFFLQRYGGAEQVAQYAAAWALVDALYFVVSHLLLQSVLYPLFVQLITEDRAEVTRLARDASRWLLAASLALMFGLAVESDRIIGLIFGPRYPDAVWLQQVLVFTLPFSFLQNLANLALMSLRLERLVLLFFLLALAATLAWCWLAMPAWPLLGAGLAMVLARGVVASAGLVVAQRRLRVLPWNAVGEMALVAGLGLALYGGGLRFLPRELAECLGLLPLAAMMWRWHRGHGKSG